MTTDWIKRESGLTHHSEANNPFIEGECLGRVGGSKESHNFLRIQNKFTRFEKRCWPESRVKDVARRSLSVLSAMELFQQ